jgi:hypothetical protein
MTLRRRRKARRAAAPPRRPLSIPEVIVAAARAGRRDWPRIIPVAIGVSLATALVEILVEHYTDPANLPVALTAIISASAVSLLGTVFLSGFICRLVAAAEHGHERVTLGRVARALPWGRLILADILMVVIVVIGLLALVLPGLIALTALAVTGPLIEIENQPVLTALRRSASLVRRRFWTVALLATLPLAISSEIEALIPHPSGGGEILAVVALRGVVEGLLEAAIGLILVQLCYRLIAVNAPRPAPAGGGSAGTVEPGQALRREI